MLYGSYGIEDMNPLRESDEIIDLIKKIHLIPDEDMEDREKGIRGACVELQKINGEILKKTIFVPKGDPENPLTRNDIINKLRICAGKQLDQYTLISLVEAIEEIEGKKEFINPMSILKVKAQSDK